MSSNGSGDGGNGNAAPDPYAGLEFPCRFEIKVMGRASHRFRARAGTIVTRHLAAADDLLQVLEKPSRNGRYVSLTYIIRARGKAQIRAIYAELSRCELVLMTL